MQTGRGSRIGSGIGARRAADGRLIDCDNLVKLFSSLNSLMLAWYGSGPVQLFGKGFIENLIDQRTLSGA